MFFHGYSCTANSSFDNYPCLLVFVKDHYIRFIIIIIIIIIIISIISIILVGFYFLLFKQWEIDHRILSYASKVGRRIVSNWGGEGGVWLTACRFILSVKVLKSDVLI